MFQRYILIGLLTAGLGVNYLSAQQYTQQNGGLTAPAQYPNQNTLSAQYPLRGQPIQVQPMQTPPKSITHNGIPVYQAPQNGQQFGGLTPPAQNNRTTPSGFNSPYPTERTMPPATNYPAGTVLTANTQGNPNPQSGGLMPSAQIPPNQNVQYTHRGHDEPASRIIPFTLTPQEEAELNEFLVRWEKYSEIIKRYEIDFTSYYYDPAVQRPNPADTGKPVLTTFGFFKYVAPSKFVFQVEGEWLNGKKIVRDKQGEDEQPKVYAEKITIDDKAVYYYDYNAKTVKQIDIPPEMLGKGIADSPLPLIFGAKADDMKKRFYLKLVTAEQVKDSQIWLQARPRSTDDQQEFSQIEIRLDKKTLRATALKKDDINGKAHTVYVFNDPKVNDLLGFDKLRDFFTPAIPRGWKHTVETLPVIAVTPVNNQPVQPHPMYGNPLQPQNGGLNSPVQNNEIQLYSPK